MPTTLYLRSAESLRRGLTLHHADPFWDIWDGVTNRILGNGGANLKTSRGTTAIGYFNNTLVNGPTSPIGLGPGTTPRYVLKWMSYPLAAAATISGPVTINIWAAESNAAANAGLVAKLFRVSDRTALKTSFLESARGVELGTSPSAQNWSASPTSIAFEAGDRILLCLGADDAGGNMNGSYVVDVYLDGPTDGSNGDSWIRFSEDLLFAEADDPPAGTVLHLRDIASDVSITGRACREMWTAAGSSTVVASSDHPNGPVALQAAQWSPSGTPIEWYSRRLQPVTLSGTVRFHLHLNTVSGYSAYVAELAVVDGDGANPNVWALAESGQLISTSTVHDEWLLSGPPYGIAGGRRLRLRLYHDDLYTASETAPLTAGTTRLRYNGLHSDLADATLTLAVDLSEWTGPPGPVTDPYLIAAPRVF
jgi:hypothetical protein